MRDALQQGRCRPIQTAAFHVRAPPIPQHWLTASMHMTAGPPYAGFSQPHELHDGWSCPAESCMCAEMQRWEGACLHKDALLLGFLVRAGLCLEARNKAGEQALASAVCTSLLFTPAEHVMRSTAACPSPSCPLQYSCNGASQVIGPGGLHMRRSVVLAQVRLGELVLRVVYNVIAAWETPDITPGRRLGACITGKGG